MVETIETKQPKVSDPPQAVEPALQLDNGVAEIATFLLHFLAREKRDISSIIEVGDCILFAEKCGSQAISEFGSDMGRIWSGCEDLKSKGLLRSVKQAKGAFSIPGELQYVPTEFFAKEYAEEFNKLS